MVREGAEANGPGQDVAGHAKDQKDRLRRTTEFAPHVGHAERFE